MRQLKSLALLVLASLAFAVAVPLAVAQAQDAVQADASHHKVEFENAEVRVVRYTIPPHEKTTMHSHPKNVQIMLSEHNARVTLPDGKTTDIHGKAGQVAWRAPGVHMVENIGDTPIVGILVEPRNAGTTVALVEALDPVKVDSQHHKLEFENDQVRILRFQIGSQEKTSLHQHPDNVQVMLTDAHGRLTAGGKTTDVQAKAGDAHFRPATTHTAENIGDQPLEGILVELKGTNSGAAASK